MWGAGGIGGGLSAPPLPLQCSVSKSKELGRTFLPAGAPSGAEQSRLLAYDTLGEDPSEKNCTLALTARPEQCLRSPLPSSSSVMAAMPSAKSPQISTTGARDGTRALACGSMIDHNEGLRTQEI